MKESNETCWINYNFIVTKLVNCYVHCYVDCKVGITSSKVGAKLDNVLSSAKVWAKTFGIQENNSFKRYFILNRGSCAKFNFWLISFAWLQEWGWGESLIADFGKNYHWMHFIVLAWEISLPQDGSVGG